MLLIVLPGEEATAIGRASSAAVPLRCVLSHQPVLLLLGLRTH
jgi:hypothetical protein